MLNGTVQAAVRFRQFEEAVCQAGGVGLNLVVANHVFMMDPWYATQIQSHSALLCCLSLLLLLI